MSYNGQGQEHELAMEYVRGIFTGIFIVLCALLFVYTLSGCANCTAGQMKCHGTSAVICSADHYWEISQDCATVDPNKWACVEEFVGTEYLAFCEEK
jgi:hypothetical protein